MTSVDLSKIKFDSNGLIPAIVQDAGNGQVLMMAWMNREAVLETARSGLAHFYSRSRKKLWMKGETSGHVQKVREILVDCDADCLLVKAEQAVAACHTGHRSCFFTSLDGQARGEAVFDPGKVYSGQKGPGQVVDRLFDVVMERKSSPREGSYTARLFSGGIQHIGGKVLEEASELVGAAEEKDQKQVVREAADLAYHCLVLLAASGATPGEVREEIAARFGKGGLEEKAGRK